MTDELIDFGGRYLVLPTHLAYLTYLPKVDRFASLKRSRPRSTGTVRKPIQLLFSPPSSSSPRLIACSPASGIDFPAPYAAANRTKTDLEWIHRQSNYRSS